MFSLDLQCAKSCKPNMQGHDSYQCVLMSTLDEENRYLTAVNVHSKDYVMCYSTPAGCASDKLDFVID